MADYTSLINENLQFTDSSTNDPISWSWDFGDGTTSTEKNPTHKYDSLGTFVITHTATNICGTMQCLIKTIEVTNVTQAGFSGVGIIILVGLAVGYIFSTYRKK